MELENEEKCTYCREYGNLPCDECNNKLEAKKAMSKTKFTKVAIESSAQFENNKSYYFINIWGEITKDVFISSVDFTEYSHRYKHFLKESPDREDEMLKILKEGIVHLNNLDWQRDIIKTYSNWITNVETLLESLKQEK